MSEKPHPTVGTAIEVRTVPNTYDRDWYPATVTAVHGESITIDIEMDEFHYSRTRDLKWWNSSAVRIVNTKDVTCDECDLLTTTAYKRGGVRVFDHKCQVFDNKCYRNRVLPSSLGENRCPRPDWCPLLPPSTKVWTPPIVALDIDGVLRPQHAAGEESGLEENCCRLLHRVIEQTRCKIVLSSAWRYSGHGEDSILGQCLRGAFLYWDDGVPKGIQEAIIGQTRLDKSQDEPRHEAILDWIAEHKPATWVAVDNLETIKLCGEGHYLQVDEKLGMTSEDAERLIDMLGIWVPYVPIPIGAKP